MMLSTMKPSGAAVFPFAGSLSHPAASQSPAPPSSIPAVVVSPDRKTETPTNPGSTRPLLSTPFGSTGSRKNSKKPKRPLTAYHIYFQIEREFIIQTLAGEDADKSIHEGKIFFHDVPERYINTKLSPDWYFGPGKRAKRKHRKQHGKIGFLELSRLITSRWAKLEETNPDIKQFVSRIAKQETDEYKRELKEYKENLTKNMIVPAVISKSSSSMKQQSAPQLHRQVTVMMPQHQMMEYQQTTSPRSPSFPYGASQPGEDISFMKKPVQLHQEVNQPQNEVEYSYQQRIPMWGKSQPKDDFDYCISLIDSNTKALPKQQPCRPASPAFLDPLMFLDHKSDEACTYNEPAAKKQPIEDSRTLNFVDICDDDILSMWNATNCD